MLPAPESKTVSVSLGGETHEIRTFVQDCWPPEKPIGLPLVHMHGHASELAEGADLIPELLKLGRRVIAMDLPSCGRATKIFFPMIRWDTGPLAGKTRADSALWFTESFVWALVAQHFEKIDRFVLTGGSLGGNLALRMNGTSSITHARVAAVCAWSAACVWTDAITDPAVSRALQWARPEWPGPPGCTQDPAECRRIHYWHWFAKQADQWYGKVYRERWTKERHEACLAGARAFREEVYCEEYRSADWRIAGEQIGAQQSHFANIAVQAAPTPYDAEGLEVRPRYTTYDAPSWIGWGLQDNYAYTRIADNSRRLAKIMREAGKDVVGSEFWTGHSIHNEAPVELAARIHAFLTERGL